MSDVVSKPEERKFHPDKVLLHMREGNKGFFVRLLDLLACMECSIRNGDLPKLPASWCRDLESEAGICFDEDVQCVDTDREPDLCAKRDATDTEIPQQGRIWYDAGLVGLGMDDAGPVPEPAELYGAEKISCDSCDDAILYRFRGCEDFCLGLETVIRSIDFAAATGCIPALPHLWGWQISFQHGFYFSDGALGDCP